MGIAESGTRPLGSRIARAVLAMPDKVFVNRSMANANRHVDAFYDVPSPLPGGRPGDVIKAESSSAYLMPLQLLRYRADTWRVMYLSTNAMGEQVAATGTLLVPRKPYRQGPRPLIGYACGGQATMSGRSAPSVQMKTGAPSELPLAATYLLRGWAVMIIDYQRFGTDAVLPFAISDPAGYAVIDGARAAQRVVEAGLDAAGPVAFAGYSLGGHAAAAAVERQPRYAPELNVVGAVAGGGPADLLVTARRAAHGPLAACLISVVAAMKAAYPELPLDRVNERGRTAFAEAPRLRIEAAVIRYGFRDLREFIGCTMDEFLLDQPLWRLRVEQQKLGQLTPTVPVLLYHGRFDHFNPLDEAARLCADWRAGGADITYRTYPGEHLATIGLALPALHRFLAERFENAAAQALSGDPNALEPEGLIAGQGE